MRGKSGIDINSHSDPLQQAAEWFAVLQAETATDIDREHWRQWLQANEAHREAWGRVERIDRQFHDVSVQSTQSAREILQVAGQNRRRLVRGLASVAIATPWVGSSGVCCRPRPGRRIFASWWEKFVISNCLMAVASG